MTLYYDYDYPSDNYVDYVVVPDIYENVLSISGFINLVLQVLSILVSIFHLVVLLQKELRTSPIYILMSGICLSDIFGFSIDFYFVGIKRKWFPRFYTISVFDCLRSDFQIINVAFETLKSIFNSTRPVSVTLAILMEIIRTLVLIFPRLNIFSKPVIARCLILLSTLAWLVYYSWNFAYITSLWYPDNLCDKPELRQLNLNLTEYVYTVPKKIADAMDTRERLEHWIRIVPAVFYPIITIEMIIRLKKIHDHQKQVRDHHDHDNLPNLILFMTLSFMLSEGTDGLRSLVMVNMYDWNRDHMTIVKVLSSSQNIVRILRCFNTISHPIVCYFMSIHYRNTVKRMMGCRKKPIKVVPRLSVEHSHLSQQDRTKII